MRAPRGDWLTQIKRLQSPVQLRVMPVRALLLLYAVLALAPLAAAALQGEPPRSLARELSAAVAMVAFAMLLMEFVLSGRFRALTGRAGIDATMRFHQLAGRFVLGLAILHPLLYAAPGMLASPRLRSGVVAAALLGLLVVLAVLRDRMRYEHWRLGHGLGAALIAALALHHTLAVGSYAIDPWLAGYWIAMTALALFSLVFVYVLKPASQLARPWRVVENRRVAHRMWEVAIEPERGAAPDFAAGQFAWLNLGHSPFSIVEHPFSISSSPAARPRLAFTIKESGDFTNRIGTIALGTRAYVDGPHGSFTVEGRTQGPLAFVAGGVGFAPIMGMLRDLAARGHRGPLRLVYGNRIAEQILYRDEVEALAAKLDLRVDLVLSEPPPGWQGRTGELTPQVLGACLDMPDRAAWTYFVCGPGPMMDAVERALHGFGVPRSRIMAERFNYG
jgi:predicted ferric reductase